MNSINDISEELKSKILQLISIPGLDTEEIATKLNIEHDKIIEVLAEEYCKYDLDQGRRLCCRF